MEPPAEAMAGAVPIWMFSGAGDADFSSIFFARMRRVMICHLAHS